MPLVVGVEDTDTSGNGGPRGDLIVSVGTVTCAVRVPDGSVVVDPSDSVDEGFDEVDAAGAGLPFIRLGLNPGLPFGYGLPHTATKTWQLSIPEATKVNSFSSGKRARRPRRRL